MKKSILLSSFLLMVFVVLAQTPDKKTSAPPPPPPPPPPTMKNQAPPPPPPPSMTTKQNVKQAPVLNATPELKNARDSASYAYGIILSNSLKRQLSNDLNREMLMEGLDDGINDSTLVISMEDANRIFGEYNRQVQMKAGEVGRVQGEKFLAENKKRKGVTTTASGLQYEVMKSGTGSVNPKATDKVKVHYHGTLITGETFDSSVDRGEPTSFPLNQVISGWTEGVQLMKVGDKFKFFIPYNLAYGERSAGPTIKPYSALIFEVELLEIQ